MIEVHGSDNAVSVSNTYYIQDSFNDNSKRSEETGGCAIAGTIVFLVLIGGGVSVIVAVIGMIGDLLR